MERIILPIIKKSFDISDKIKENIINNIKTNPMLKYIENQQIYLKENVKI